MKQAIVIGTTPSSYQWLQQCLESLKDYKDYPIVILSDYNFELGKIRWMYENTHMDEFLFLPDTVIIRKPEIFKKVFDEYKGHSVTFRSNGNCYMVKYRREILDKMKIPIAHNKDESIFHENYFNKTYLSLDDTKVLFPNLVDILVEENTEQKFGGKELKMENEYFCKWKGIWDVTQYRPLVLPLDYLKEE
jgi:hypothetical protein